MIKALFSERYLWTPIFLALGFNDIFGILGMEKEIVVQQSQWFIDIHEFAINNIIIFSVVYLMIFSMMWFVINWAYKKVIKKK